jgi:Tol biopolymer transport system component
VEAAAVAAAIALFVAGWYAGANRRGTNQTTAAVASFAQVTDQPGVETTPSLSPDGKTIVFAKTAGADTDLYLSRIGGRNAVRLTPDSPGDDSQPAFSPDGERIAFRSARDGGGVFLMTASGESVTRLTDFGYSPSWSPDGAEVVVAHATFITPTGINGDVRGLSVVDVKSGRSRALAVDERALQPSWSPSGARIAYWAVRETTGQRDIWTVAADGSDVGGNDATARAVTSDTALDWSPAWSPDGRYLYFSSTRGGTMNLWRVPMDERSGRVLGEPEPVTTPSTWSGHISFSRDGRRMAFGSLDYRSTLFRIPYDPVREAIAGPPVPVLKGTRPIRDHELSPDGQWIAFNEAGVQEDLFVARVDGTQLRRLTDDGFRDRGPAWAPDGTRIAFYSDRANDYDVWTIRPDGSGLTQLTRGTAFAHFPVWSPDGAAIAFGWSTWHLMRLGMPSTTPLPVQTAAGPAERFMPASWSLDGEHIAGQIVASDGASATVGVYSMTAQRFSRVPGALSRSDFWLFPVWLADSRRLLVRRQDGVAIVDAETGQGRLLIPVGGDMVGRSVGVSRDNRWITYTETATEGNIWVATIVPPPGK